MAAKIIDGKKIADGIAKELKAKAKKMPRKPHLAVVLVGENPASMIYVKNKEKRALESGFDILVKRFPEKIGEAELLEEISNLNNNNFIDGMIVQLPLPKHIDEDLIIDAILPHKDADGFNPINLGNMFIGKNMVLPATPKGVIKLIESTGVKLDGLNAVVIGRSNIVGKPVAMLLLQKNMTVTVCHSKTKDLKKFTLDADVLVAATGKPGLVTGDMIKKGAIVIDVGTTRVSDKLVGDVDFDSVSKVAGYITPVQGGVGPMTIAMLLENTLECMMRSKGITKGL